MKSKAFEWTARTVAVLVLTASIGAFAQHSISKRFSGVINAYTLPTTTTGPYEVRGPWSLTLKRDGRTADFSAALNMVLSDGWVLTKGDMNFDPTARGAHTHHITLVDAEVTKIANGFRVTGTAHLTLNGGPAPTTVAPSPVVIDITGGSDIKFSNIALTFESPGSTHFGPDPLPGVVRSVKKLR
jgi:hypothetical protein